MRREAVFPYALLLGCLLKAAGAVGGGRRRAGAGRVGFGRVGVGGVGVIALWRWDLHDVSKTG
jgi:hypothetical protein